MEGITHPMDTALLIVRLVVGLYLAAHGAQKLFGWFEGHGFAATQGMLGGMLGYRPAWLWTLAVGLGEFVGGLLFALGLLSPIGAIGVAATMLSATLVPHWSKGPFAIKGGYELSLTNLAVAAAVGFAGPGAYSLDQLLGITVPIGFSQVIALVALVGVLVGIVSRRAVSAQPQTQAPARAA
jgi:putative oxidoreductase